MLSKDRKKKEGRDITYYCFVDLPHLSSDSSVTMHVLQQDIYV